MMSGVIENFTTDRGVLYLGDARDVLKTIPDESVNFIFTSPPYNVGFDYEGYNDSLEHEEYKLMLKEIFDECYRVLVKGGRMAINTAFALKDKKTGEIKPIDYIVHSIVNETKFKLYDRIIWVKSDSTTFIHAGKQWGSWMKPSRPNMRSLAEAINIYYKDNVKYISENKQVDITEEEFKELTHNLWFSAQPRTKYNHPCPFSVNIVKNAIKLFTYVNDVVLDPFCGIGSALIAALQTNRRFIGIEISPTYYKIAKERIEYEHIGDLFQI